MKSDCFHYDKEGRNVTLAQIQQALVTSFNRCCERGTNGVLGCTAHYVMGKGDWKWRVEFLRQPRHYGNIQSRHAIGVCPRCYANKHNWIDVLGESFNKAEDIESARATACGPNMSIHTLSGWHCDMEMPDVLHTIYLGTGRDLVGSLILQTAEACFEGSTWDERLLQLRAAMQGWCVDNGLRPSTIPELRP